MGNGKMAIIKKLIQSIKHLFKPRDSYGHYGAWEWKYWKKHG